jgi:hypothetical protein
VDDTLPPVESRTAGARIWPVVDVNRLLGYLNAVFVVGMLVAFFKVGGNDYMNGETVVLAIVLAVQTQTALLIERRRRDPFVVILAFILIMYFSLRFLTLLVFPFSFVFDRFAYTASDSNFALTFIIIANVFLLTGFYAVRGNSSLNVDIGDWRPTAPMRVILLVLVVITVLYSRGALWDPKAAPRALQVLLVFASQSIVLLMALAYYVVFRHKMTFLARFTLLVLLVSEMVLHTLAGSRSAFVYALQNVMIVVLAARGFIVIRRKYVLLGLASLPITASVLVAAFAISTVVTVSRAAGIPFKLSNAFSLSSESGLRADRDYALKVGLPVIFGRAGFFDFSAEVIAHRREYERIVTPASYVRSVIDNLLTPGFDIFDQPKIANALAFAYAERGSVSKAASAEGYQSDQLGIYGELFLLFGYASLPMFFVGGYLIKRAYFGFRDSNPFMLTMKRVLTLAIFVEIVNSFGLDWVIADIIPLIVSIYIYRIFFTVRHSGEAWPSVVLQRPAANGAVANNGYFAERRNPS